MSDKHADGKWISLQKPCEQIKAYELGFASGDELIYAGAAVSACRLVGMYDEKLKKAAILHCGSRHDVGEIRNFLKLIKAKKFNKTRTRMFLVADNRTADDQSWNDTILSEVRQAGYNECETYHDGKGKDLYINPGAGFIYITNDSRRRLFLEDPHSMFDAYEDDGLFS